MIKIPTMFERDEMRKGHPVIDRIKPECQWVLDGKGQPTVKIDGTNVLVQNGYLYKRQKPKSGDYDEASYVPCDRNDPSDRWAMEAFDARAAWPDGVYELVGPKVQGNPYEMQKHRMVMVVPCATELLILDAAVIRTFEGIRTFLAEQRIEGIVFHHADGRLAKIKRRDFGLPWPVTGATT